MDTELRELPTADLRALVFWAGCGVKASVGGSYEQDIPELVWKYSVMLGTPTRVNFMSAKKFSAKQLGSWGGKASAAKLTPEERKKRATKASHSRKPLSTPTK